MKTKRPNLGRLTNASYLQLMKEHRDVIIRIGADNLKIKNYFDTVFMVLLAQLIAAFNHSRGSSFTEFLVGADSSRDDAFYSLGDMVKSLARSRKAEVREAAERVYKRIEQNGNLAKKSMDEETSYLNDLVYDLKTKFAADILILGIESLIEDIEETNNDFDDVMKNRYQETENKSDVTVGNIRKKLDEAFRNSCNMIEMLSVIEPNEIYSQCIKAFNAVFARYGGRSSTAQDDDKTPDTPTTPEEPTTPPVDYPDAIEWYDDYPLQGLNGGEIFYLTVAGNKVYYKLVDKYKVYYSPESAEGKDGWEKLN